LGKWQERSTWGKRRFAEAIVAGKKPIDAYLAPTPDVDSGTWLNRIKAEDARRKAVEAQLATDTPLHRVLDLASAGEPPA
jgi:adenosyl cobinamide kinase/adenosyl cobinamide phosphate guanylyltransferase